MKLSVKNYLNLASALFLILLSLKTNNIDIQILIYLNFIVLIILQFKVLKLNLSNNQVFVKIETEEHSKDFETIDQFETKKMLKFSYWEKIIKFSVASFLILVVILNMGSVHNTKILLILGLLVSSFLSFIYFFYLNKKMVDFSYSYLFFVLSLLCMGIIFKFLHWPGADIMIIIATIIFVLINLLFGILDFLKLHSKISNKINLTILSINILNSMLGGVFITLIFHWKFNHLAMSFLLMLATILVVYYLLIKSKLSTAESEILSHYRFNFVKKYTYLAGMIIILINSKSYYFF